MNAYHIQNRRLCSPAEGHAPIPRAEAPVLYFGEKVEFLLTFPEGTLAEGDVVRVAVDTDKDFLNTAPMAVASVSVAAAAASVAVALDTRTERFRDTVNGKPSLPAVIEVARWRPDGDGGLHALILCDDACTIRSIVSDYGDDVRLLPEDVSIPRPTPDQRNHILGVDDDGLYALVPSPDDDGSAPVIRTDAASLAVSRGQSVFWTPSGDCTLDADMSHMAGFSGWARLDIDLTDQDNPATVTLGDTLEFALDAFTRELDMLLTGYVNKCGIEWNGTGKAVLHVFGYGEAE